MRSPRHANLFTDTDNGPVEELGTGIDKVIQAVEFFQLPPPIFETPLEFTKTTLWAYKLVDADAGRK